MNNPFEQLEVRLRSIETLLQQIKAAPQSMWQDSKEDELLTVQGAAEFLSLSVPTIYGLISKNELPVMKRSKRCYFSKSDLINYLREGRKKSNSEIEQDARYHKPKGKK